VSKRTKGKSGASFRTVLPQKRTEPEDGTMDHPQIDSAVPSQPHHAARSGDCVYQFAIILAALLMIASVALF
jgi:hypothetical protein